MKKLNWISFIGFVLYLSGVILIAFVNWKILLGIFLMFWGYNVDLHAMLKRKYKKEIS
jgi:hypothetical protein